ncbi:MAG: hypothetical protein K9W44_11865 [Candidatus Lokiarchaeota archaeon]|nr:hypothetical protein [Candidatus Harpocratesius repetitus]
MEFHWTVATIVMFCATIPQIFATVMSIRGYIRYKYKSFLFMIFSWGFMGLGNIILAFGYLFMDFMIYRIGIMLSIPLGFAIIVLFDSISKDQLSIIKFLIMSVLSTALIILGLENNSVVENVTKLEEHTPAMNGLFQIFGSLVFLFAGTLWLIYSIKIYTNAPKTLKKIALINMIGAIIAAPGSIIAFGTGFVWIIPGTDYTLIGIGALLCAYSFYKEPKLGYVLPFVVYRLHVIQADSGLPIYEYTWNSLKLSNNALFSGAIKGVSSVLKESLGKWEMNEILFDKGRLIFEYDSETPLVFLLITSKSTAIMRQGLRLFREEFVRKFRKAIDMNYIDLSKFDDADKLICSAFPFVVHR